MNNQAQRVQTNLNARNAFYDPTMKVVDFATIQQVNDLAFYRRDGTWIDSRLANDREQARPTRVIEFGSAAYHELVGRLARDNRQGSIALRGDIRILVDGEAVLVRAARAGQDEASVNRDVKGPGDQ